MSLIWPLPALLTWSLAWGAYLGLDWLGASGFLAFALALLVSAGLAWRGTTPWRRVFMVAGFPLSLVASGAAAGLPAWAWLLPLALLLLLYPLNAWQDAPLFPTPLTALDGLQARVPLRPGAKVVDAGCGLGAGLLALRRVYPAAELHGLEWSWPLAVACALRCRFACVRRADIWSSDWSAYDMVYLFQRPESMARAMDKAEKELASGNWLVSLEFEASGYKPSAKLQTVAGKPLWLYQAPFQRR
ncbi:MAG: class I SAM-dependent methyltransferase [Burkholderiaceae bacterium]